MLPGLAGNQSGHLLACRPSTNPNSALIWGYELSAQTQPPPGFNRRKGQHYVRPVASLETEQQQVRLPHPPGSSVQGHTPIKAQGWELPGRARPFQATTLTALTQVRPPWSL